MFLPCSVKSERTLFQRNQFARITMGVYKGDLCQIMQVLNGGTTLVVTMVPRINLQLLGLPKDQKPKGFAAGIASAGPGGGKGARAPQRFFDKDEIMEASNRTAVLETRNKYGLRLDVLGSNQYYNGMLIKEVKNTQLTAFGPPPTLEEISKFRGAAQKASSSSSSANDDEDGAAEGGSKGGGDAEAALLQAIESAKQAGVGIAGINTGTSSSSSSGSAASGPVAGSGNALVGGQGAGGSLLLPGDSVVVVKGDLTGLSGKVVVLNGSTFTLQPSSESAAALGLTDRLEIPCEEAMKTFNVGDHVKAIGGFYIGETGTVIALKHVPAASSSSSSSSSGGDASTATWLATILLDSGGMKQVQAFVRDLTKSTDVVTSTAGNVEGYELHDLVEMDSGIGSSDGPDGSNGGSTEAGVIIALGQRDVTVLMTTGVSRTVPVQHLRGKINMRSERSQAFDILGQPLEIGDVVKVQGGSENRDRTGTVKHIYRIHLFLHDFTRPMHSGMFVARSRLCVLAGTRVKAPGTIPASNAATAGGLGAGAFGGAGRGQMMARGGAAGPGFIRRPAVDDFAGATVRITKGPQKGKIGIVKSMTFSHVAVEMHSGLKTISFPRDHVMKVEARVSGDALKGGAAAGGHAGGYLPAGAPMPAPAAIGGQTPFIGGMGGATPAYGGGLGGATPAFGLGGATPAVGEFLGIPSLLLLLLLFAPVLCLLSLPCFYLTLLPLFSSFVSLLCRLRRRRDPWLRHGRRRRDSRLRRGCWRHDARLRHGSWRWRGGRRLPRRRDPDVRRRQDSGLRWLLCCGGWSDPLPRRLSDARRPGRCGRLLFVFGVVRSARRCRRADSRLRRWHGWCSSGRQAPDAASPGCGLVGAWRRLRRRRFQRADRVQEA